MSGVSRREFLEKAGMSTAVAGFAAVSGVTLRADPLGIPIGSQTYPERQMVADGKFPELLKNMYAAGIRQIELCSPGYAQFKSLADGKQTKKIIEDNGLKCISSHFSYNEFKNDLGKALEWAQAVGMTQVGTGQPPGTSHRRGDFG
jgi:sugar phosphate isomerase/epimerase